ncbi:MAG: methyltransferase domain-containing protein [Pseudomonadota bacterium]
MDPSDKVSSHYRHGSLLSAIRAGLKKQGIAPEKAGIEDLGPVDEFHIGGRVATAHFLDQLQILPAHRILDVGCGLGGSARFAAKNYGCTVAGIDLTEEYVATGQTLCDWVGLSDRVHLWQGNALSLPFSDEEFDGAFTMHASMNIEGKQALFSEVARVLKPGARLGIYDIMQASDEDLVYPVPWATTPETSWLAPPEHYRNALENNGLMVERVTDRRDFALDFFTRMKRVNDAADGPPPLGLHVLMQQSAAEKIANMVANLIAGRIAPVEMIAVKGG